MGNNIFRIMNVAGQGMQVQRQRLNAVANNIANANTTKDVNGLPYHRETIVSSYTEGTGFSGEFDNSLKLSRTNREHSQNAKMTSDNSNSVVQGEIVKDAAERLVYEPNHPDADADGYVHYPDINIVTEMVDMISAQRGFEANTQIINTAKNLARFSLEI